MLMLHRFAGLIGKEYLPDIFTSLAFLAEIKPEQALRLDTVASLSKLVYASLLAGAEQQGLKADCSESEVMDAIVFGDEAIGTVVMDVAKLVTDYTSELTRLAEKKKAEKVKK